MTQTVPVNILATIPYRSLQLYERVLGKPDKTLLSHSLDTGYTCEYLLTNTVYKVQAKKLATALQISEDEFVAIASYICAMHDAGKLHPLFQAKLFALNNSVEMEMTNIYGQQITGFVGYRHECGSKEIILEVLKQDGIGRIPRRVIATLLELHHQGQNKGCNYNRIEHEIDKLPDAWKISLMEPFCNQIKSAFPCNTALLSCFDQLPIWAFDCFLGILMTCDWIASGTRFSDIDTIDIPSLQEYKAKCFDILKDMSDEIGMKYQTYRGDYSYSGLFNILLPRTMQDVVRTAVAEHPEFDCILIEAPTGEGKTEASLYAAMQALLYRSLQGIYVALPTGLTSETMMPRVTKMLECAGIDANIRLTTGTAWLSELNDDLVYHDMIFRKFGLLERFGVGTVDQLMAAAMLAYDTEIKMAALGSKVVVIDEIHSYDSFMMAVIKILLQYLHAMNTPVIMMSATLSDKARTKLLSYYNIPNCTFINSYPRICVVENEQLHQYACPASDRKKAIKLSVIDGELDTFYESAVNKVKNGGCLAFVTNSVSSAIKARRQIESIIQNNQQDTAVYLYLLHARFSMTLKEIKTQELVSLFGKDRTHRPKSAIVIATPIIEMSMDLDFDFMYRQIAPVDAIIQSMGRVARHDDFGTIRASGIAPEVIIMKTKKGNRIYAGNSQNEDDSIPILEVTARVLSKHPVFNIPKDVPDAINAVYDDPALASYYHDEYLNELAGQLVISDYLPSEIISPSNIRIEAQHKTAHPGTRQSNVEYVSVAVMDQAQIEQAKSNDIEVIRQVYKDTVVSIPAYYIKDKLKNTGEAFGLSVWFSDVYIDDREEYFTLDSIYGLISV